MWQFMNTKTVYSRKISRTEAQNDFIFILKNKLSLFPNVGNKFELVTDDSPVEVKVESYPCTCRGPERPHEHYFIRWKELKAGSNIKIMKEPGNGDIYRLKINY